VTFLYRFALILTLVISSGCATSSFESKPTISTLSSLKGSRLYVYSFLDSSGQLFGPKFNAKLEEKMQAGLKAHTIESSTLLFGKTEVGIRYSRELTTRVVPVQQTIDANLPQEKEFAATHRVIIFPKQAQGSGGGGYSHVSWEIIDISTGKRVWETTSSVQFINMWKSDESPDERAGVVVNTFLKALKSDGLL
jgi:hypothetical protein